ncbi:MAG: GTPase HflX [Clostridia bacterium]|nr:GTPase HflX [Clostridia bacterium]
MKDLFKEEGIGIAQAVLVGLITYSRDERECAISMDELERLLDTAGGSVYARMVQSKDSPDSRTCIGSGKVLELRDLCRAGDIRLVVFDCDLTPAQIKNLERELDDGGEVRVIDRSMLILDIFALHATSAEGKLQVELAQLRYTIPRLSGHGTELSRLGGGIGTRGPGETKLESDRRHIKRRIAALEEDIRALEATRMTQRKQREKSGLPKVAVAGYTNAGKSTLLNTLTGAGILAEDKLFATLDPTTRKFVMPDDTEILLTDTVGFIRNLPHHLISAFRSTLEEVLYADVILVVLDFSDPECDAQLAVTKALISDLGAADKPILYALNKCDVRVGSEIKPADADSANTVEISAKTGWGLDVIVARLVEIIREGKRDLWYRFGHTDGALASQLYKYAAVLRTEYLEDGVYMLATSDKKTQGTFAAYLCDEPRGIDGE